MAGTTEYFYMRMNSISKGKEILLSCHPTFASVPEVLSDMKHWKRGPVEPL
jgi:hypothetical protein